MLRTTLSKTLAAALAGACLCAAQAGAEPYEPWLSAWAAPPGGSTGIVLPGTQTIRDIISPRRTGNTVRLHLTNRQGTLPVTFSQVFIGTQQSGAALVPGSNKQLTFAGSQEVTLQPGQDVVSDPLSYPVKSFQKLAISMQNGNAALGIPAASSSHPVSRETNYYQIAAPSLLPGLLPTGASQTSADGFEPFVLTEGVLFEASWEYIEDLDVQNTGAYGASPRTIVAFGDSIADGLTVNPTTDNTFIENVSNLGAEQRFEDYLQHRFDAMTKYKSFNIVSAAIAGNRLTQGPFLPFFGPSGLSRLQTDVLDVPGVTDVIISLGINDIAFDVPAQTLGSTQVGTDVINGYVSVIDTLHAHGIRAILSTILPARGAGLGMFAPAAPDGGALHGTEISDEIRVQVNAWILGTGSRLADGVIDFSSCMQDPTREGYLNPAYNSGDNLHPNAAGYSEMAQCVNLPTVFP